MLKFLTGLKTEDEPIENLYVEIPSDNVGDVMQSLAGRKGEVLGMDHHANRVSIEAVIPTRGLIGFKTDLVNRPAEKD